MGKLTIWRDIPDAGYVLGMNMVWSSLSEVDTSPLLLPNEDITDISWRTEINQSRLNEGRDILYQAALKGHLQSLIDLSISYYYEIKIQKKHGENEEELKRLKINAIKYGELAEELIKGTSDTFFQTVFEKEFEGSEINKVIESAKVEFNSEIQDRGYREINVTVPEQYHHLPEICEE